MLMFGGTNAYARGTHGRETAVAIRGTNKVKMSLVGRRTKNYMERICRWNWQKMRVQMSKGTILETFTAM